MKARLVILVPHPLGWAVFEVLNELRHSEHRFGGECKETERLYEHVEVEEGEGQTSSDADEHTHELHVAAEVRPVPEVAKSEVWKILTELPIGTLILKLENAKHHQKHQNTKRQISQKINQMCVFSDSKS